MKRLIRKVVAKVDPKLDQYRAPKKKYVPLSKKELLDLLQRTPREVLSDEERTIIAAAMSFAERPVKSVMLSRDEMTFVHENDFLGPLMLDKLFKSGFLHFPVVGASGRITGLLHTKDLNDLKIKDTDRAGKYLDENVYYIRGDHTLQMAMAAFLRTNCHFFVVIDMAENPIGLVTYEMVVEAMLGKKINDDFDEDLSAYSVAHRNVLK